MARRSRSPTVSHQGRVTYRQSTLRSPTSEIHRLHGALRERSEHALFTTPSGQLAFITAGERDLAIRFLPDATALPASDTQGEAAEIATRDAASLWGLPDFVMRPVNVAKGRSSREVGDAIVVSGDLGLIVQVKARMAPTDDPDREAKWLLKMAQQAARQAAGTRRTLASRRVEMQNERDHAVSLDGSSVQWVGVVVIEHSDPPEVEATSPAVDSFPVLVLLRRDWEFLFQQLRSTSAVVDYVHRVASLPPERLGREFVRYYELAEADATMPPSPDAPWIGQLGAQSTSGPKLPKAPPDALDTQGHLVFRAILEDVALGSCDLGESRRLDVLAMLDRFSVGDRAQLGRLLLEHFETVSGAPKGETHWRWRRVIQDDGHLQLGFGACTKLTEATGAAFRSWVVLRHHELLQTAVDDKARCTTVGVLVTPRSGGNLWDTTLAAAQGWIELDDSDLAPARSLWNQTGIRQPH